MVKTGCLRTVLDNKN